MPKGKYYMGVDSMDVQEIVSLIGTVGFPIVVCGVMFKYINTTHKELVEAINGLREQLAKTIALKEKE